MPVCAMCRKERKLDQLQEGKRLCIDRRKCQSIAFTALHDGTPAQAEAKRLRHAQA